MHACMYVCGMLHVSKERVLSPLELELQALRESDMGAGGWIPLRVLSSPLLKMGKNLQWTEIMMSQTPYCCLWSGACQTCLPLFLFLSIWHLPLWSWSFFIDDLFLLCYLIVCPPEWFIVSWLGRLEHSLDSLRTILVYKLPNTERPVAGGFGKKSKAQ